MCFFRKRKERQHVIEQEKAQLAREEAKEAVIVEENIVEPQSEIKVETFIVQTPSVESIPVIIQAPIVEPSPAIIQQPIVEPSPVIIQQPIVEPSPVIMQQPIVEPKRVEPTPAVKEVKPSPVVKEVKPTDEVKKEKAPKIPKYHVSQNKDENTENFKKWRVRKEGSEKTIKFFDTQKDAIDYASGLAESAGSTVVIHKVDGSIRKQDYVKKP